MPPGASVGKGLTARKEVSSMSVARVTEISSTSTESFEDAIKKGLDRAQKTLRNLKSAWIKDQNIMIADGKPHEFKINMLVTFELED
jgi:dodecin